MATVKSVEITNLDTTPRTTLEAASAGGKLRVWMDTYAASTGDLDNDDIIVMAQVPSNAKIVSLRIYNDDLNSGSVPSMSAYIMAHRPIRSAAQLLMPQL
tara:strand:- start:348 stop:647 length:300 start_codon:yes stop_codon:yes gene_type:complete